MKIIHFLMGFLDSDDGILLPKTEKHLRKGVCMQRNWFRSFVAHLFQFTNTNWYLVDSYYTGAMYAPQNSANYFTVNSATDGNLYAHYSGETPAEFSLLTAEPVNVTENGTQTVTPDSGKVLSSVVINTNVPAPAVQTQEKSVTITQNGASEVTPDTGKYLSKVSITTNVPSTPTPTQEKTQEITTNTTTTITPDEGYALSSVTVITNVPQTLTQEKTVDITANGQTVVEPDAGNALSKVTVNVNVAATGSNKFAALVDGSITEVTADELAGATKIKQQAFYECAELASIGIPDTVTSIEDNAFTYCDSLISVVIPDTVTSIGSGAFYQCNKLRSVKLSSNITELPRYLFNGCRTLKSITIPSGVTSIASGALSIGGSTSGTKATITMLSTTPPSIESDAFSINLLNQIIVPAGTGETYKSATNWANFADYIVEATA